MLLVGCGDKEEKSDEATDEPTQEVSPQAETSEPTTEDDVSANTEPQLITVWVINGEVPVSAYSCPEVTCDVVDTLFPGMEIDIVSIEDDWHEITLNAEETGYIQAEFANEEERVIPPENSSLPPGVTPSDETVSTLGPPPLSAPPGMPTFDGTIVAPTDGPPSDSSLPPGVPTQDPRTTVPNSTSNGPPNVTSGPPPGVSD